MDSFILLGVNHLLEAFKCVIATLLIYLSSTCMYDVGVLTKLCINSSIQVNMHGLTNKKSH